MLMASFNRSELLTFLIKQPLGARFTAVDCLTFWACFPNINLA